MKKVQVNSIWLVLATYGVWFAIFSGIEELLNGKYWKVILSLVLGVAIYIKVEKKLK